MLRINLTNLRHSIAIALVAVVVGATAPVPAFAQEGPILKLGTDRYAGELEVPVNKSQILEIDQPVTDIFVGNPEIADVIPLAQDSVYILGKALGSTSLSIYGKGGALLAVADLVITQDVEGLKRKLFDLLPNEKIEVRAVGGSVTLSGTVSSAGQLSRALAVAERFAPEGVTNLMSVKGSQQVMLAVRFAEVKRTVAKELGLNNAFQVDTGNGVFSFLSGLGPSPTAFGSVALSMMVGSVAIDSLLDTLEAKGVVKTLAEPNLIALSGDTASFLAGGEFPIPVAQESQAGGGFAITVEFKEFGVSLAFTPTVVGDDLISMVVAPEVSAIDPTTSVTINSLQIPGLTTRRAKTTVELRDGQSFAIAGLLQSDFASDVSQFPLLGDLPVLGALFRSPSYRREETELVIIVTPYLVKPAYAHELALPTDDFAPPSDADIFLYGRPEGEAPVNATPSGGARPALSSASGGGLDGPYGHIVE